MKGSGGEVRGGSGAARCLALRLESLSGPISAIIVMAVSKSNLKLDAEAQRGRGTISEGLTLVDHSKA